MEQKQDFEKIIHILSRKKDIFIANILLELLLKKNYYNVNIISMDDYKSHIINNNEYLIFISADIEVSLPLYTIFERERRLNAVSWEYGHKKCFFSTRKLTTIDFMIQTEVFLQSFDINKGKPIDKELFDLILQYKKTRPDASIKNLLKILVPIWGLIKDIEAFKDRDPVAISLTEKHYKLAFNKFTEIDLPYFLNPNSILNDIDSDIYGEEFKGFVIEPVFLE